MTTVRELVIEVNIKGNAEEKSRGLFDGFADIKAGLDVVLGAFKVAGDAIASFTTEYVKAGDEIAKNARNIGISAESLQELDFAAKRSGASAREVQVAIQRMGKGLNDAFRTGTGPFADSLEQLGLGIEDVQGLTPDQAFIELSEAISRVEDPMTRAALAQDFFGRGGKTLLPLINEGRAGIEALTGRARELGLAYSNDAAKATEDFADAQLDLETAAISLKSALASELLPSMQAVIASLTDWIVENKEFIEGEISQFISKAVDSMNRLMPLLERAGPAAIDFAEGLIELSAQAAEVTSSLDELDRLLTDDLGFAWTKLKMIVEASLVPFQLIGDAIDDIANGTDNLARKIAIVSPAISGLLRLGGAVRRAGDQEESASRESANFLSEGGGVTVVRGAERLKRAKTNSQLKAIADDENERPVVRALASERLQVSLAEDAAFVEGMLSQASDVQFVGGVMAQTERAFDPTSGFRPGRGKGKKKDEKIGDEELKKLISKAAAEGIGLESVLGGREIEGGTPPVISVEVKNTNVDQRVTAQITVNGVPGETAEDTATRVRSVLEDVLQEEYKRAIEEIDTPVSR